MTEHPLPSHPMRFFAHFYVARPTGAHRPPPTHRCWRCDLPADHPIHLDPDNPGAAATAAINRTLEHARRHACASSTPAAMKDDASPTSPPAS